MKKVTNYLLRHEISGNGERTIVLLHGYLSSSHYFKTIRPRLEKDFRVVTLDLLGFGHSPKPNIGYTYTDHIAAIQFTLKHIGVTTPFILLGHSMGALIALRYTVMHQDEVESLLLFNPPLFINKAQMIATHKASGRRYRIMLYSRARQIYWPVLKLVPRDITRRRSALNFADIVRMSSPAREGSYKNIISMARVFQDLRQTRLPVLLVVGRYDRDVYLQNLKERRLPANVDCMIVESDHHTLVKNVAMAESIIRSHLIQ